MEEKEVKVDEVSISDTENKETEEKIAETVKNDDESSKDVAELTAKLSDLNDKYLRLAAELENTRRRAVLDAESSARNRAMSVAKKFLPVMDAVEAALKLNPDDDGIKSMQMALLDAFAQIGITKIESVGQVLNPQYHNAIQVVEVPEENGEKTASNTIVEELQPGYMFGDTVLRTAMVVVAK